MSKKFTGITSAGSAIPVYDKDAHSALEQKLDTSAFSSVSGEFATVDDVVAAVSGKADTSAIPSLDGYATQEWVGEQGYLTEVPESAVSGFATHEEVESATSGKMNIADMTAYQTVEDMSAYQPSGDYQPAGDYYSASNPSGFITGVDLTPYQTIEGMSAYQPHGDYYSASNPSGFIDANALTPYQTIEGMTAYQPVGDYQPSGDYLSASESANFYPMTGNPSGFLTEHQSLDGLMETSGLEYDGDKISGYMGSAFAGGGEVPEGVMVESAVGYNAVNEISGYNGSAIAQYGAEKQWLVHDDTLVHAANSAQYALGVNLSAVAQLLGVDETVLWEGSGITTAFTLSEAATGFNKIRYEWRWNNSVNNATINSVFNPDTQIFNLYAMNSINANKYYTIGNFTYDTAYKNITYVSGWQGANSVPNTATNIERFISIRKIIGIGRKQ